MGIGRTSRYRGTNLVENLMGSHSTTFIIPLITMYVKSGMIETYKRTIRKGERLDQIAGEEYGMSDYWWIIAAASGIGFPLQVTPGTVLSIPKNIDEVLRLAQ